MTERQKLIAYKQTVQAAKNKLKQMSGISILELLEHNENPGLNEMFSAYTTTSVSYTHLDVYKRQVLNTVERLCPPGGTVIILQYLRQSAE